MVTVKGSSDYKRYMAAVPDQLTELLRGAARAGAKVVADEIKARTPSEAVRDGLRIRTKKGDDQVTVKIDVKPGWARSVGTWLEYGTSPHFISVDDSQRQGMTPRRINDKAKGGSLVIGGNYVGSTVFHPGARPVPAFRPALDIKAAEAISTAQGFINARVTRSGIVGTADTEGSGE